VGLVRLAAYPFLGWAAVVVVVTGVALFVTFPIGNGRGKSAARRYFLGVLGIGALLFLGVVVWGIVSGQFAGVLREFGWALLFELAMFAILYGIVTGFPFLRYLQEQPPVGTPGTQSPASGHAPVPSGSPADAAAPPDKGEEHGA
jgi:hypothetical protein